MRKISSYLLLVLWLVPAITIKAQNGYRTASYDDDMVEWNPNRPLTWDDYQGLPDRSTDAAASTTTYLTISYNISSTGFTYRIQSKFSKSRSWGLYKTPYILSHEQGHFDISEIFARKLNQRLQEYNFNSRTYERDLKKIYDDILEEKSEMQESYDEETRHSINRTRQAEWLKKIANLLEETRDYADY